MGQNSKQHVNEGLCGKAVNNHKHHGIHNHGKRKDDSCGTISGGHGATGTYYTSIQGPANAVSGVLNGNSSTHIGVGSSNGSVLGDNYVNLGTVPIDGVSSMAMGSYSTVIGSSRTSERKPREVTITPLDFGFIVKVGCQSVAVENVEKLVEKLSAYLKNPGNIEEMWNKDSGKTVMNEFVGY